MDTEHVLAPIGEARVSTNPYRGLPDSAFWRRAVAIKPHEVDPVVEARFRIGREDRVATAGSCFAQHISRTLAARGFNYLVTEPGETARNFGVYPARFGNIYSVRQLLQLFRRAYGLFEPVDQAWRREDGRFVDPFRPQVEPSGFADPEEVARDRDRHLAAVRTMFEECDVFIFTLGLTEAWHSTVDGAVFPLAPGVAGMPDHRDFAFHNFSVAEMVEDLTRFIADLRLVNPAVRILLTVSPVPLIATYETRHVLVSTVASKAALRVVADEITRREEGVDYFPSFEIITGPHYGYRFFASDLREVRPEGVARVMDIFARHYMTTGPVERRSYAGAAPVARDAAEMAQLAQVVCDEEAIER